MGRERCAAPRGAPDRVRRGRDVREVVPTPRQRVVRCRMASRLIVTAATSAVVAASVLAWSSPARAWVESHQAGDDVRIVVDSSGVARFEHAVTYRVSRGPLRSFDLGGIEKDAVLDSNVSISAEDRRELTGTASMRTDSLRKPPIGGDGRGTLHAA